MSVENGPLEGARGSTSPWMDTDAAASYLVLRPATMKAWRCKGKGPNYQVVGRRLVRYHRDDLDAFARGEVQR